MLSEYTKYYYYALSEEKKKIYLQLYDGIKNRVRKINIHTNNVKISPEEISEIAVAVYNDTPSFYYLDVTHYSYVKTLFGYTYSQKYLYSTAEIEKFDKALEKGLGLFKAKYIKDTMSEYERELTIHDYLVRTVTYDYSALENNGNDSKEAFNVLGALLYKKAVCWGIACAFKLLCDYCGLKSFVVVGDTIPKQEDAGHAWNIVKIENKPYHVDVTWDIKEKGDISFCYDYFNLDDTLIKMDHTWSSNLYPQCSVIEYNYYYKNQLYVRDVGDISKYVAKQLRMGKNYVAFKFANAMPPVDEIEKRIKVGVAKALRFGAYKYYVSEKTHNIYIEME